MLRRPQSLRVPTVANTFPTNTELVPNHHSRRGELLEFCAAEFRRCVSARYAEQMRHVEAVTKMLDPGYSLRAISVKRRQPNPWFKRHTVYRRAVDVLGTATEPLTARDIAERVLAAAIIKRPDKAALVHLTGSILASLRNHKGNGIERTKEGAPARGR